MRLSIILLLAVLVMPASAQFRQSDVLVPGWNQTLLPAIKERVVTLDLGVSDINNDGYAEAYVVTSGSLGSQYTQDKNRISVFLANGTKLWSRGFNDQIRDVVVYDVNNDRNLQFVVSAGDTLNKIQRGNFAIVDERGSIRHSYDLTSVMNDIFITDLDGDRYYDIVAGGEKKLFVFQKYMERVWTYPAKGSGTLNRSVDAVWAEDMDGDQKKEVIAASDEIFVINAKGVVIGDIDVQADRGLTEKGIKIMRATGVSRKGLPDIVVVTNDDIIKMVHTEDVLKGEGANRLVLNITWTQDLNCKIKDMKLANIDADDADEIILACSTNKVYAIDNNGAVAWSYPMQAEPTSLFIGDIDGDNIQDLLVGTTTGALYSLDLSGKFQWVYETGEPIAKVASGDMNGDRLGEIAIVTTEPRMKTLFINENYTGERVATTLFKLCQDSYLRSKYEDALDSCRKAKVAYIKIGDDIGASAVQKIVDTISSGDRDKLKKEADMFYTKSQEAFSSGDFTNALIFVNKASEIYNKLAENEGQVRCELLKLQIDRAGYLTTTTSFPDTVPTTTTIPPEQGIFSTSSIIVVACVFFVFIVVLMLSKRRKSDKEQVTKDNFDDDMADLEKEANKDSEGGKK